MGTELIDKIKKEYPQNGCFKITAKENIASCLEKLKKQNIEGGRGIYVFTTLLDGKEEIKYIGKAGTILNSGEWREQHLFKRISNKNYQPKCSGYDLDKSVNRQAFFDRVFEMKEADAIKAYWFVTMSNDSKHLPSYAEGKAMQLYFEEYKKLPKWNNQF